jgi:hypothetical protein
VNAFLKKVRKETGYKATRKHIWLIAGHSTNDEFKRWQRHDPKTRPGSEALFSGILDMPPARFVEEAKRFDQMNP